MLFINIIISSDYDRTLQLRILLYSSAFFFFQAEDGIRDYKVTGVQTCALPIYADSKLRRRLVARQATLIDCRNHALAKIHRIRFAHPCWPPPASMLNQSRPDLEIGRASCRERV